MPDTPQAHADIAREAAEKCATFVGMSPILRRRTFHDIILDAITLAAAQGGEEETG